jgi:uncharacterized protein YijF (DUF1287 family)
MFLTLSKAFLQFAACLFLQTSFADVDSFLKLLVKAAQERTKYKVNYDGAYCAIAYSNG